MAESKPCVSKHILDKAAFIFLRHPEQAFTRRDIQHALGISKSTAARLMGELSSALKLEEVKEGQTIYYLLLEEQREQLYKTLNFILAVNDRERLALNFLLHGGGGNVFFDETVRNLENKFDKAGILTSRRAEIKDVRSNVQKVEDENGFLIDTILNALETRTKIKIDYKGAFSDRVKTHELWPVGMYLRDDNLYLYAYSPRFEDATSYAYSRITGVDYCADEHYEIPEGICMDSVINDPFGIAINPPRRVKVRILNNQVFFEKEKSWPEGTVITDLPDGSIRMEISISDYFAFKTWALSLGENCVVEEPEEFVTMVREEHRKALELYE